jgi:Fe2+ transport system protein FeoA
MQPVLTLFDAECEQTLRVIGFQGKREFQHILMERGIRKGILISKCCKGFAILFTVGTMKVALREEASKCILVEIVE